MILARVERLPWGTTATARAHRRTEPPRGALIGCGMRAYVPVMRRTRDESACEGHRQIARAARCWNEVTPNQLVERDIDRTCGEANPFTHTPPHATEESPSCNSALTDEVFGQAPRLSGDGATVADRTSSKAA